MRERGPGIAVLAIVFAGLACAAAAEPGTSDGVPELGLEDSLLQSPRLLGDPAGVRSDLESLGVSLSLYYHQYLAWKPRGGAVPDAAFGTSGTYDFFVRVDFEELTRWRGLVLLFRLRGGYDRNVNAKVGALSDPIDDADFDSPFYVDELWLEQSFLRDHALVRLGFLQQQTLFDRNAYANSEDRQFATSFLDNNPVVPLPNGLGGVLIAKPMRWLEIAAGIADTDNVPRRAGFHTTFDDLSSLTGYLELLLRPTLPSATGPLSGNVRLGLFLDGREREGRRGHLGFYVSLDQQLYREQARGDQGLGFFGRFGYADPSVHPLSLFWSVGLQYVGLLPRRDADVVGVGVYQAIGSRRLHDTELGIDRETGIEAYYRIQLLPWLQVSPDVQVVLDPGGQPKTPTAVVALLRLGLTF